MELPRRALAVARVFHEPFAMKAVDIAGKSEIGPIRSKNEDCWLADGETSAAVVTDGVGGAPCGEAASRAAAEAVMDYLRSPEEDLPPEQRLREAVRQANDVVRERAARDGKCAGMASTAVACVWEADTLYIANVGDSRFYLWRVGELTQLSHDHTLGNEAAWRPTAAQLDDDVGRVLTMAVGSSEDILVHIARVSLEPGDRALITTDGVHGVLPDEELANILGKSGGADKALERLLSAALRAGTRDNLTAVVIEFSAG